MADPKEIIKKINDGSLTYEEQLALLSQVEQTIKEQKQKKDEQLQLKSDYIVQAFNKIKSDLEQRINEIEVKEPVQGPKGDKGDKGDRGADGYQGRDGKDGKDGVDGVDGIDGIGVADARIDFDGTLVITLTNGKEITAGDVVPLDIAEKLQIFYNNSASGSGGSALEVKNEGTTLSTEVTSIDFTGDGVTATNTGGAISVAITGGGGISSADIQEFTTAGTSTWTKPAGAKLVYILAFGGGGGGGSGRRRATASVASAAFGGGGGAAGGRVELWIPAIELGATETVTVGAGGTGGSAVTVDDTSGNAGIAGYNSTVGSRIFSRGGSTGATGGTTTSGPAGTSTMSVAITYNAASFFTSAGGVGSTVPGLSGNRGGYNGGGGGGGSGFAGASTTESNANLGGKGGSAFTTSTSATGGGGDAGLGHSNGGNGSNAATYFIGGDGGGGGGGGSSVAAGAGGNGGFPGGGGGGGGAGHGANSGAGGNGGSGYVRIVTFF